MALPSSFDPDDPRFQLPDPSRTPAPKPPVPAGKPGAGPGWGNRLLMILSVAGMAIFSPVLFKLNHLGDDDTLFTAAILLPTLGFFLSLIVFAGGIGVRVVHWLAEWFVDLIFGVHGGGSVAGDTWTPPPGDSRDDDSRRDPGAPPSSGP